MKVCYHVEGRLLRGAKLDTFVDEDVEVALPDVGGHLGPELRGDDRPLQGGALRPESNKV